MDIEIIEQLDAEGKVIDKVAKITEYIAKTPIILSKKELETKKDILTKQLQEIDEVLVKFDG